MLRGLLGLLCRLVGGGRLVEEMVVVREMVVCILCGFDGRISSPETPAMTVHTVHTYPPTWSIRCDTRQITCVGVADTEAFYNALQIH